MAPTASDVWFFARIRSVVADRDGRVYALEDTDQSIRVFGPDGRLLRTIGKRGAGPGEFAGARFLQVLGDTLWVYDNQNARLTPFSTTTGALMANTRRGPLPLRLLHLSSSGVFAAEPEREVARTAFRSHKVRVVHSTGGLASPRVVAEYTRSIAPLSYFSYAEGKPISAANRLGQLNTRQPLESAALLAPGHAGGSVVLVQREPAAQSSGSNPFAATARSHTIRIVIVGPRADTLAHLRVAVPTLSVTDAHVAAIVDSLARPGLIARGQRLVGDHAEIRDSLYRPPVWPATTEVFVGSDGTIWLRQPSPPSTETRFWRLRSDGTVLPSVSVGAGLVIHQVSEHRIWGVREDTDGVPRVETHEIVPRR